MCEGETQYLNRGEAMAVLTDRSRAISYLPRGVQVAMMVVLVFKEVTNPALATDMYCCSMA